MKDTNSKTENYEKVMESTLAFIASKGLDRVTVSTIARLSKVSRTWIYKYIGSSKESLIRNATLHIGKVFSELAVRPEVRTREDLLFSLSWGNRQYAANLKRYPWIPKIFFQYSQSQNLVGTAVQEILSMYYKILATEIEAGLGLPRKEALRRAELYTAMKMGAGYWWSSSALPPEQKRESFLTEKLDAMIPVIASEHEI
jgi:AcrR family transcriptional regulator